MKSTYPLEVHALEAFLNTPKSKTSLHDDLITKEKLNIFTNYLFIENKTALFSKMLENDSIRDALINGKLVVDIFLQAEKKHHTELTKTLLNNPHILNHLLMHLNPCDVAAILHLTLISKHKNIHDLILSHPSVKEHFFSNTYYFLDRKQGQVGFSLSLPLDSLPKQPLTTSGSRLLKAFREDFKKDRSIKRLGDFMILALFESLPYDDFAIWLENGIFNPILTKESIISLFLKELFTKIDLREDIIPPIEAMLSHMIKKLKEVSSRSDIHSLSAVCSFIISSNNLKIANLCTFYTISNKSFEEEALASDGKEVESVLIQYIEHHYTPDTFYDLSFFLTKDDLALLKTTFAGYAFPKIQEIVEAIYHDAPDTELSQICYQQHTSANGSISLG